MADQYVYVKDPKYHWIPGLLVETTKDTATVSVAQYEKESEISGGSSSSSKRTSNITVRLKDYPNGALPLQNVKDGKVKEVRDMIELGFLHEAAILFNLKARHLRQNPYTRTGDIVIAVNPYQWFPKLYTEDNRTNYSKALVWEASKKDYDPRQDLPPHVYETSALAYKGLSLGGQEQSILVSGESGAGKTETVKICMNHLASVVQQEHKLDNDATTQDEDVITRVLDSNPLLEAFGNAKTRRNDNSSRFGKFVALQFLRQSSNNPTHLTLVGSMCEVYLLEKSRVVYHDDEERTFHIFYQLLATSDKIKSKFWKKLKNTTYESFAYVGDTDTSVIEGISDKDKFQQTLASLAIIGIKGELLQTFMTAICVVLQLGNITFGPSPKDSDHSIVSSSGALQDLADVMGINSKTLEQTLIERQVKVRGEVTMVPLNADAAKDSINALAKQIYDRIFLWLVRQINAATTGENKFKGGNFETIGLLDIFGFESFQVNSFEQLCINYANEQLQQKFTKDVFVSVFEEYKEEGINLDEITYDDNTHVLDLIQNRTGLLAMLNEECVRPGGSDYGFVNKATAANKSSPALIIPRIVHSNVEFGIRHYAGDVMYDATDFVTKNQDTLPSDLMECAQTSSNDIIAKELSPASLNKTSTTSRGPAKSAPRRSAKSNLVAPTAWTKYKDQLSRLMKDLHKSESRYIRCVKPNSLKKPKIMEHGMTLQQLRSSGVVAAVTLARSAFPNRLEHQLAIERFYPLWPPSVRRNKNESYDKQCSTLLSYALKKLENENGTKAFVIGRTRSYFRAGALEYLEASRLKGMEGPATVIQCMVRCFLARRVAYKIRHKVELEDLAAKAAYAVVIQCAVRVFLARKEYQVRFVDYMKQQAKLKKKEKKLKKLGTTATKIQKVMRGALIRMKYRPVIEKAIERSNLKEKVEKLKKKIAKAKKNQRKEMGKAQKGVDLDNMGRDQWEASVLAASDDEVALSETAKRVEHLQNEHRKLQIKSKTLEGMLKPLKKNFDTLMEENNGLRAEFAEVHKKNEELKKKNKELIERREAAEKKTKSMKQQLKSASIQVMPDAQGRLDYQKALKEIMTILKKRCHNKQIVKDATSIASDCQAAGKSLQAEADASERESLSPKVRTPKSRKGQRLGDSFSGLSTSERVIASMNNSSPGGLSALSKSPQSVGRIRTKNRSLVQGSLGSINALVSPGVHAEGKKKARARPRKYKSTV